MNIKLCMNYLNMKPIGKFCERRLIDSVLCSILVPDKISKFIPAGYMVGWVRYMIRVNRGN